ncbi:MAG: EamA family transporter [Deltaproteobacteria bacterium]
MKITVLALIVAAVWGIAPIFEKLSLAKATPFTVITLRFVFTTAIVLAVSLATGKYREIANLDGRTTLWILLAGVLGGIVGLFIYFIALKQGMTSKIIPVAATFPLFTAIYASIFLGETLTFQKLLGIVIIVVGLVVLNWNSAGLRSE